MNPISSWYNLYERIESYLPDSGIPVQDFLEHTQDMEDKLDQVFIFPTHMGGQKWKLIHYVAGK
jgi:hypothetical protein